MLQTRCLALVFTFFTVASSLVIQQRQAATTSSVSIRPTTTAAPTRSVTTEVGFQTHTVTHTAVELDIPDSTQTSTVSPTPTSQFDDNKEGIPPPDPDPEYYEDEGAGGKSDGFIDVSIGAQAGIIIAIVVVGLAIMVGCIVFWSKKKKEWKAALERRRTLRASRRSMAIAAAAQNAGQGKTKGSGVKGSTKKSGSSSSSVNSTEVKVVERADISQFDVMTPVAPENPWWKKALGRK